MKTHRFVKGFADPWRLEDRIVEGRGDRSHPRPVGKSCHKPRTEWHPVGIVVVLEKFRFQLRDIHARRALAFAGFAGKAEIHNLLDFIAVERLCRIRGMVQNMPEDVGAGACRMFFLPRGHVARAHRPAGHVRLPAVARAVAFFRSTHDTLRLAEIKNRFIFRGGHARRVAQAGIHRRRVHDLAGIKKIFRIKRGFDRLHQVITFLPDHERNEFSA